MVNFRIIRQRSRANNVQSHKAMHGSLLRARKTQADSRLGFSKNKFYFGIRKKPIRKLFWHKKEVRTKSLDFDLPEGCSSAANTNMLTSVPNRVDIGTDQKVFRKCLRSPTLQTGIRFHRKRSTRHSHDLTRARSSPKRIYVGKRNGYIREANAKHGMTHGNLKLKRNPTDAAHKFMFNSCSRLALAGLNLKLNRFLISKRLVFICLWIILISVLLFVFVYSGMRFFRGEKKVGGQCVIFIVKQINH